MRSNRKISGIVIILIGLILIILIIYFGFIKKNPTVAPVITETPFITGQLPSGVSDTPTTTPSDQPRNYQQYEVGIEGEHKTDENDLIKTSQAFAERFGSYSNYSNYSNFTDLKLFMTEEMKVWADAYVEDLRTKSQNDGEYFGITTTALTSEVLSYDDSAGQARIMVNTQRRESTSQVNEGQAYFQKIEITLKKVNDSWLVDKAYWQKD
ncbi:MAG: hypothetical protein ACOX0H_03020 [Patescibacteria group bacterium]|jgi:hypothetical protein|nr:hypothetical protein [bacterium]